VAAGAWRDQALLLRLGADPGGIETGAIVAHADQNLGTDVRRAELDPAFGRFARGGAAGGVLDPMVDRVADEMHERIGEPLDEGLVEFGVLARGHEFDRFAEIARKIMDEPAEASKQRSHGHHAGTHRRIAQR
jgi:hypothetical protein